MQKRQWKHKSIRFGGLEKASSNVDTHTHTTDRHLNHTPRTDRHTILASTHTRCKRRIVEASFFMDASLSLPRALHMSQEQKQLNTSLCTDSNVDTFSQQRLFTSQQCVPVLCALFHRRRCPGPGNVAFVDVFDSLCTHTSLSPVHRRVQAATP